jgi:uncharacterized protein (UPF0332 family)
MDEEEILEQRYQIRLYLDHARQALAAATLNLEHGFYSTAINRAYNAVICAATGLLRTRGIRRSTHSGVIAAFRQHFALGLIETEYSDLYSDVMDARIDSDYEASLQADEGTAQGCVDDARRFVDRAMQYLLDVEGIQL